MVTLVLIQVFLSTIFFVSAFSKLLSPIEFRRTISELGFSQKSSYILAVLVLILEFLVSILILFESTRFISEICIFLLLISFIWSVWKVKREKKAIKCNCFGNLNSDELGNKTIIKIIFLGALNLILIINSNIPSSSLTVNTQDLVSMFLLSLGLLTIFLLLNAFYVVNKKITGGK